QTSVSEAINRNSQEKMALETRLSSLRSQIGFYSSMASAEAPPPATRQVIAKSERLSELNRRIIEAKSNLAALGELYKENYPNVRAGKALLQSLESERDQLEKEETAHLAQQQQQLQKEQESAKPAEPPKKVLTPQMAKALEDLKGEIAATETAIRAKDLDI